MRRWRLERCPALGGGGQLIATCGCRRGAVHSNVLGAALLAAASPAPADRHLAGRHPAPDLEPARGPLLRGAAVGSGSTSTGGHRFWHGPWADDCWLCGCVLCRPAVPLRLHAVKTGSRLSGAELHSELSMCHSANAWATSSCHITGRSSHRQLLYRAIPGLAGPFCNCSASNHCAGGLDAFDGR